MADQTTIDEGRSLQFQAMMEQFAAIQAKYKGVRGELLAKVRDELMRLKPGAPEPTAAPTRTPVSALKPARPTPAPAAVAVKPARPTPAPAIANALPSCRLCGRGMKPNGDASHLICERGHTRTLT